MKPAIKRILVPTDLSDLSLEAIRYAESLGELYGAHLVLFYVVDEIPVLAFQTMDLATEATVVSDANTAEARLQAFARSHDIRTHYGISMLVGRGNPSEEITRTAEAEAVDLIVMATHGRTGFAHVLMGSVAEKVVQRSSVPVLTVKPVRMRGPAVEHRERSEPLHA